jgi:hypothetical protein
MNPAFDPPFLPNPLAPSVEDAAPAPETEAANLVLLDLLDKQAAFIAHQRKQLDERNVENERAMSEIRSLKARLSNAKAEIAYLRGQLPKLTEPGRPKAVDSIDVLRAIFPRIKEHKFQDNPRNCCMELMVLTDDGQNHGYSIANTVKLHGLDDRKAKLCRGMADYLRSKGYDKPIPAPKPLLRGELGLMGGMALHNARDPYVCLLHPDVYDELKGQGVLPQYARRAELATQAAFSGAIAGQGDTPLPPAAPHSTVNIGGRQVGFNREPHFNEITRIRDAL